MVNSCCEGHLRWLEGIVGREVNAEEEDASGVRGVIRSHDSGLPCELILLVEGSSRAIGGRVFPKIDKFFLDAFEGHIKVFRIIDYNNFIFPFIL